MQCSLWAMPVRSHLVVIALMARDLPPSATDQLLYVRYLLFEKCVGHERDWDPLGNVELTTQIEMRWEKGTKKRKPCGTSFRLVHMVSYIPSLFVNTLKESVADRLTDADASSTYHQCRGGLR